MTNGKWKNEIQSRIRFYSIVDKYTAVELLMYFLDKRAISIHRKQKIERVSALT